MSMKGAELGDDAEAITVTEHAGEPVALDPFAFFGDLASRIPGLGGTKIGHDPKYVFHSPYVETARGRVSFTIRFHNLQARRGTLVLYVNMLALDGKTFARLVTTRRIALNRLQFEGGATNIEFEGFRNMSFAIFGQILDDSDVSADALEIILNNPPRADDDNVFEDARTTTYRAEALQANSFLTDLGAPNFTTPVSQSCTSSQFSEPAFREWADQLGLAIEPIELWGEAFILQVLRRYGMLKHGAHAMGFDVGRSAIPALLAKHGLVVTATDPSPLDSDPERAAEAYRNRLLADGIADIETAAKITYRQADLGVLPRDLINFDVIWSHGVLQQLLPIGPLCNALEAHLRCLRPGGIAVHIMNLARTNDATDESALRPADVERIALLLISRGHEIARMKFARRWAAPRTDARGKDIVSFGLIIRKAISPL